VPLFPTLPDPGHGPGQHKISEHTSAIRRAVAAGLSGYAVAALAGLVALVALYLGADDTIVLLMFLGALVGAVGVGVAVWMAELEYSPGANARRAIDQRHVERITAITRQFDLLERLMAVERD
jgi:hypothetical protein